jgi:hypothetical protein
MDSDQRSVTAEAVVHLNSRQSPPGYKRDAIILPNPYQALEENQLQLPEEYGFKVSERPAMADLGNFFGH